MPSQVNFRCHDADLLRWRELARLAGLPLASWIKSRLDGEDLDGPEAVLVPKRPKPPAVPDAVLATAPSTKDDWRAALRSKHR